MNSIILNEEELKKIAGYKGAHEFENFIFNNYKLILNRKGFKVIYEICNEENVTKIKMNIGNEGKRVMKCEFAFRKVEEGIEWIQLPTGDYVDVVRRKLFDETHANKAERRRNHKAACYRLGLMEITIIDTIQQYIMNESYERKTILKESGGRSTSCAGERRENVGVRKPTTHFLLKDIVEYVSHGGRRNDIRCECWGVRGHFRHYKNGRVIWISAFEKGSKRNSGKDLIDKQYVV